MGHTATWKVLEELMLDIRKKGAAVPPNVISDLRNAKLMIKISQSPDAKGEQAIKVDEYLGNVESVLLAEAQKTLGGDYVDAWLKRIDEANVNANPANQPQQKRKKTNSLLACHGTRNG